MLADDELRDLLVSRLPELRPDVEAELDRVLTRAHSRSRRRRASYVGGLAAAVAATVIVLGHDWQSRADAPDVVDNTPVQVEAQPLVNRGMYAQPRGPRARTLRGEVRGPDRVPGHRGSSWTSPPAGGRTTSTPSRPLRRRTETCGASTCSPTSRGSRRPSAGIDEAAWVRVGNGAQAFADTLAGFGSDSATTQRVTLGGYDGYRVTLPGRPASSRAGARAPSFSRTASAGCARSISPGGPAPPGSSTSTATWSSSPQVRGRTSRRPRGRSSWGSSSP